MHTPHRRPQRTLNLLLTLCALAVLTAGCAKLTATHLQRKTWEAGVQEKLYGKFMHFDYQAVPLTNEFGVKGTAWPIKENIPVWADSVQDMNIIVYLCDEHGNVLAQANKSYPSQKLTTKGLAFDFTLKPKPVPGGQLFISFGYHGMFVASKPPAAGGQGSGNLAGQYVFFASETAALKN